MVESSKASLQRVLVAFDAASASDLAVEAAVELAAALSEARLEGLFVEDVNLVRLGGLPFASEVSTLTGTARSLAAAEIEHVLRVEAARLERLFAQAAQRAQLPWSFAIARGQLLGEAFARAADLTVVGAIARASASPALGAAGHKPARRVAALLQPGAPAWRMLTAAAQLARATEAELLVLIAPGDPASQARAGARARSWLAGERLPARIVMLASGARTMVDELRSRRADTLVYPAPRDTASAATLRAVVAELPCLLVVVRGTKTDRRTPEENR